VTASRLKAALIVYGALAAVALLWGLVRGQVDLYHHPAPWLDLGALSGAALGLAAGLGVGALVVAATRAAVRHTVWARRLHVEFRQIFGPLSTRDVLVFAGLSSIAEEIFFRGALQPSLGIAGSSVVFGLLHIGPSRRFLPWTLMAVAMGFVFGVLYQATGDLLAPMVAHFTINAVNLQFISDYDPDPSTGRWPADLRTPRWS
jgi:uncharacterized protein